MKKLTQRSLSWLLILALCVSLLSGLSLTVSAANYIFNWGQRGVVATAPSINTGSFYSGTSYEALAALAGGTGTSDAPDSSLYATLKTLMSGKQTYITSYDATKDLYQYTDCQNGGGKISSFYSGTEIGPSWDGNWNREHTWPNSKGDASGAGENDIMMLRPTSTSENSSRGNKAYGESSGYYDPNVESNGRYNLHGDVARIMLYVYVRWGNTGKMWGSDGVIESLDVLLDWMEKDPVDTWELGRNDAVQSITGTRNVFVDYPELAFLLFGAEIPEMTTPSGEANSQGEKYTITFEYDATQGTVTQSGNGFTVTPNEGYAVTAIEVAEGTATINGLTGGRATSDCTIKITFAAKTAAKVTLVENGVTADTLGKYAGDQVTLPGNTKAPADGYTFVGWVTAETEETTTKPGTVYAANDTYTIESDVTMYALYNKFVSTGEATDFTLTNTLTDGEKVVIYNPTHGNAIAGVASSYDLGYVAITSDETTISTDNATIIWEIVKNSDDSYSFVNAQNMMSIDVDGSHTNLTVSGTNPKMAIATCEADKSTYYIYSATQEGSYGHIYIEYYNGKFTAYSTTDKLNTTDFGFQFYAQSGTNHYTTKTEAAKTYTVSFSVPYNVDPIADKTADAYGVTLPTPGAPDGYNFVGWVTEKVENSKEAPAVVYTAGSNYAPTADIELKALYSAGEGGILLVEDATTLKAGDQLVLGNAEGGAVAGPMGNNSSKTSYYLKSLTATFADGGKSIAALPEDATVFTLSGSTGAWVLTADAGSLAVTSASNGKLSWTGSNNIWDIEINAGDATIENTWTDGRPEVLHFNAQDTRFANYNPNKTNLPEPQLYRIGGGLTYTTEFVSSCQHTGGTATCVAKAICTKCNEPYGEFGPHDFTGSTKLVQIDGQFHALQCVRTGCEVLDEANKAPHGAAKIEYDTAGHWGVCECGYIGTKHEHTLSSKPGIPGHYQECTGCEYQSAETAHTLEIESDMDLHWQKCTACGYKTEKISHTYSIPGKDETHHWLECSCGHKTDVEAHDAANAGKNDTHHWSTCSVCGYATGQVAHTYTVPQKDENQHWNKCSGCDATDTKVDHSYTVPQKNDTQHWNKCSGCDATDTKADHSYTVSQSDETHHWMKCSGCDAIDIKLVHTYIDDKKNDTHHWKECVCGAESTKTAHTYTTKKSETHHWEECSCGHEKVGSKAEHIYDIANKDATHHWMECSCGAEGAKTAHTFSVAEKDENQHWNKCSGCDATDTKENHTYTEAQKNDTHHWKNCTCGAEGTKEAHVYAADKNDTHHWEECSCGYEKPGSKAEHNYNVPKKDTTHHWNECECGQVDAASKAEHEYEPWLNDATHHWHICEVCDHLTEKEAHTFQEGKCTVCGTVEPGEVTGKVVSAEGAPKATADIDTDALLTDEDNQALKDGQDITFQLDIKNIDETVSVADKELVEKNAGKSEIGMYLDIALTKTVGDKAPVAITQAAKEITVTLELPEALRNTDDHVKRTFSMVRIHNGEAVILKDLDENENTVTLKSDKFSTYALIYHDETLPCDFSVKDPVAANLKSEATCTEPAVYYFVCRCGEKGTETYEHGAALGHQDAEEIAEVAATCTKTGVKKHYHCDACGGDYLDKAATAKAQTAKDLELAINANNHPENKLSKVEAVEPGCHSGVGYKAYTYCLDCKVIMLADGAVVEAADLVVEPENTLKKVDEVKPTTKKEGMKAHWFCEDCGKYYADAQGKQEVTKASLVIPALATPATGDNTALFALVALVILGGVGVAAILIFKRKARN